MVKIKRKVARVKATAAEPCSPLFLLIFLHSGFTAGPAQIKPTAPLPLKPVPLFRRQPKSTANSQREETSYTSAPDFQAFRRLCWKCEFRAPISPVNFCLRQTKPLTPGHAFQLNVDSALRLRGDDTYPP